MDPPHSHTKATMTPSTTVTRTGLKWSAQVSCTITAMPWVKKTACTFNITTEEKLSFGASNVSFKNRCHGVLLNKILYISKFPLVLSTLFRWETTKLGCRHLDKAKPENLVNGKNTAHVRTRNGLSQNGYGHPCKGPPAPPVTKGHPAPPDTQDPAIFIPPSTST